MTRVRTGKVAVWGALAAGLWMTTAALAHAQFAPQARPRHGFVPLQTGFTPDPRVINGQMGGPVNASQVNPSCRGFISSEPSHVIRSPSGFRYIRFVVSAQQDSTLMVMLPNGQLVCDDDGGGSLNPLVQTTAGPGDIRVWVGAYSQSVVGSPYVLGVTELQHVTAANLQQVQPGPGPIVRPPVVNGINPNMPPAFGVANLRAGFMPDPHVLSGRAIGNLAASSVAGGCTGYVSPQPSHVINSPTGFRSLRLLANSGGVDTTLLVMMPNGQIVCDDDGGDGNNPLVQLSSGPGSIRVWVGTYRAGEAGAYNLGITELSHISTGNIPAPGGYVVQPTPIQPQPQPIPIPTPGDIVQMTLGIPVTLFGPGLPGGTVANWMPRGGPPTPVSFANGAILAGGVSLVSVPSTMSDPVVTVTQQRNGALLVRAEQSPSGAGDRGQQLLVLVQWSGRPTIVQQWAGTLMERGPRWGR